MQPATELWYGIMTVSRICIFRHPLCAVQSYSYPKCTGEIAKRYFELQTLRPSSKNSDFVQINLVKHKTPKFSYWYWNKVLLQYIWSEGIVEHHYTSESDPEIILENFIKLYIL